jgi:hypothetical protein
MTTPRRDFLNWLGASGAFAAMPNLSAGNHESSLQPVSDKWDMSWCDRIKGKVRAVFDSPEISDGSAVFRAQVWRDEYKEVYATSLADTTTVTVLRHKGIALAMNDEYWARFKIGEKASMRTADDKEWLTANPVNKPDPTAPPAYASYSLPALLASGGIVLACNMAFSRSVVGNFKTEGKLSDDDARKEALAHLVPGVILQPSGVFATLRAQQAGCSYLLAS